MLDFQRIIFCVLFAAVLVKSSNAAPTCEGGREIENLEHSLERVIDRKLIPKGGIDHLVSWGRWKKIPYFEKMSVVVNYEEEMKKAKPKYQSGTIDKKKDIIAMCAYKALDKYIMKKLGDIKKCYATMPTIVDEMEKVANEGKFLDYIAFCYEIINCTPKYLEERDRIQVGSAST